MSDNYSREDHVPVVIIVPPFQNPFTPTLATALLKGSLTERGIGSRIVYANIITLNTVGTEAYATVSSFNEMDMVSDRLFAHYAADGMPHIGEFSSSRPEYALAFLNVLGRGKEVTHAEWLELEARCGDALAETTALVSRLSPRIVAFSVAYTDLLAAVALAGSIREALPDAVFLLGGSGCRADIGSEIIRASGVFDFHFDGEADFAFPDFCENYLTRGKLPPDPIIKCGIVRDMDSVPVPDYGDFMDMRERSGLPVTALGFESSRGCAWGARKPCNFCADACRDFTYRAKSPGRIREELERLSREYPDGRLFSASDLMIPPEYFDGFFQELATSGLRLNFVYQTKTDLDKRQIALLRKAGCAYFLAGIESLSSGILKLLNKGTSPAVNLILLRNAKELNVSVNWNMILAVPGDLLSHYREQMDLIPSVHHLHPPNLSPLMIMRFSAYARHPELFGIEAIRPMPDYARVYPPHFDVNRLATYFEADYSAESREQPDILRSFTECICRWVERWLGEPPVLRVVRGEDGTRIVEDTRQCVTRREIPLDEEQYALLRECRAPQKKELHASDPAAGMLLDNKLLVEVDGKLLSVVCDKEAE